MNTYMLILLQTLGSRYNRFGTFCGGGSKETIHCFHGSVCLQEGDTSESFKVLIMRNYIRITNCNISSIHMNIHKHNTITTRIKEI